MPAYKKMPDAMRECVGPECGGCSSAKCYAKGGEVKGVHKGESEPGASKLEQGKSMAGIFARHSKDPGGVGEGSKALAVKEHHQILGEMKAMPKPKLMAEGGETDADGDYDGDEDNDLKHAMGGEFMDAMERKDRKGIMSALEAIVLSCRGKE